MKTLSLQAPSFEGFGTAELVIIHASTPSFPTDARFAELLKARNPSVLIGMVGAKTMVDPHGSLQATRAIDFVCGEEFDMGELGMTWSCNAKANGLRLLLVGYESGDDQREGVEFFRFLNARAA